MVRPMRWVGGLLALWTVASCGGDGASPPPAGPFVTFDLPAGDADPIQLSSIPYPNDLLRDPITGAIIVTPATLSLDDDASPDILDNFVRGLGASNGFGRTTGALFTLTN